MLKKLKIMLCMLGLGALCAGAAACAPQTVYDSNYQTSEVVVRWDPNGGTFLAKEGTAIIDMYDVDNGGYTADAEGNIEVKLLDPLDPSRPSGASESDNISLTMQNYSLYGWYKSREPVLKDGKPVDGYGHVLESDGDGGYYYLDESGASGEIRSPMPCTRAVPPHRQNGTSAPSRTPSSHNCDSEYPHANSRFNKNSTHAASALPPAMPAPDGIRFTSEIQSPV